MDSIDQLLHLRQGGLSIEEYVHQFCELSYQVTLYNKFLFKDLFHFRLNEPIKSLFPGGEFKGSLRGFIDYALLYAGSSLTVGVSEEERNTASETKMADAPEGTHKMAEATMHHQFPESHNMPAKPQFAHVMPTGPGSALVVPAKPGSALVVPAKPGSALVVPAKPGSALVVPVPSQGLLSSYLCQARVCSHHACQARVCSHRTCAKPGSVFVVPAMPESPAKMATMPADASLGPGLIASVLDPPLVSVRAAGIPRSAALSTLSQELAESAPEAAPSQELAEAAPEAAPSQELAEAGSPDPLLVPSSSPSSLLVPSSSPSSLLVPPSSPSSTLAPPSSPSPLVPSSLALSERPRDSAPQERPLEVVVFPKEIVLGGPPAYRPTESPDPPGPPESPDPSWLPEAPDLLWPPRKLPTSVLETICALSVSCVSVSSRSQSLPWVSAPPWWAPVSSAPPWWAPVSSAPPR